MQQQQDFGTCGETNEVSKKESIDVGVSIILDF